MHELFVGVDAGGSHTVAALARGERVLRTIAGDAANPNVVGLEAAAAAIATSIERVVEGDSPAAIAAGVAGAGTEQTRERLLALLRTRFPNARIAVTHDARIALRAVIPQGDGAVLVAGTGSMAYAEVGDRHFRAGGYGYLVGDAGSGFAIGAAAVRRIVEQGDRDLLASIYRSASPVAEIAAYAPAVLQDAARGEPRATAIVRHAAAGLVELIRSVVAQSGAPALALGFAGGLLREPSVLTESLECRIAEASLGVRILPARKEAYLGALSEARRLLVHA
jgi:N-acetylglucosamine kinase-like BadF-type ATPase